MHHASSNPVFNTSASLHTFCTCPHIVFIRCVCPYISSIYSAFVHRLHPCPYIFCLSIHYIHVHSLSIHSLLVHTLHLCPYMLSINSVCPYIISMSIHFLYTFCLSIHHIHVHTFSVCPCVVSIRSLHTFSVCTQISTHSVLVHTYYVCPYILSWVQNKYPYILGLSIHCIHTFWICPYILSMDSMLVHALFPCILCIHFLHVYILCLSMHCLHTVCDCPYILSIHSILILCPASDTSNCHGWPGIKKQIFNCAYLNTFSIHSVLSHTLHACPYILSILMQRHPIILFTHNSSTLTQTPRRHCSFFFFSFLFMLNRYRFKTYTIGSSNSSNICLILWLIKYDGGAPWYKIYKKYSPTPLKHTRKQEVNTS